MEVIGEGILCVLWFHVCELFLTDAAVMPALSKLQRRS